MIPFLSRIEKLIQAVKSEQKHSAQEADQIQKSHTFHEKINNGWVIYPLKVENVRYTIGDNIEVNFKSGHMIAQKSLLNQGSHVKIFKKNTVEPIVLNAVIFASSSYNMSVLCHSSSEDYMDQLSGNDWGIEIIYDDRPYKIMLKTLENVLQIKDHNIINYFKNKTSTQALSQWPDSILDTPLPIHLNEAQKNAILNAIKNPVMTVIHGPPGTGKTTTIQGLAYILAKNKKKVLLCAPSNAAADLLAIKVNQLGIDTLRIGNLSRIDDDILHLTLAEKIRAHPDWGHIKKIKFEAWEKKKMANQYKRTFTPQDALDRKQNYKDAKELLKWAKEIEERITDDLIDNTSIIVSTLIGAAHNTIDHLRYDVVVIDEASQALEPEAWHVMLKGTKGILVGDHQQLPPTVKSVEAKSLELDTTLLDRCIQDDGIPVYLLDVQYRMHPTIIAFPNDAFYEGRLKTAPHILERSSRFASKPLVCIDMAGCGFEEQIDSNTSSYYNEGEVFIISEYLTEHEELLSGLSIGIISPYVAQVKKLKETFKSDNNNTNNHIHIQSIDGFQGQEKDVIIVSLTRSNEKGVIGFLKDYRRLNVALTRAKQQLIIIGDSATIGQDSIYQQLFEHCQNYGLYTSGWTYMGY